MSVHDHNSKDKNYLLDDKDRKEGQEEKQKTDAALNILALIILLLLNHKPVISQSAKKRSNMQAPSFRKVRRARRHKSLHRHEVKKLAFPEMTRITKTSRLEIKCELFMRPPSTPLDRFFLHF